MVGKGLLKVERVCACFYAAGEDPGDAWSDGCSLGEGWLREHGWMESHFPLSRCWGARETNRGAAPALFMGMWITVNRLCGSRRGQCRGAEAQACTSTSFLLPLLRHWAQQLRIHMPTRLVWDGPLLQTRVGKGSFRPTDHSLPLRKARAAI